METHVRDLAIRQAREHTVKVLVASGSMRASSCDIEGVKVTRLARIATVASMPACPGLTRAIKGSPADVVHMHTPNPAAALAFLASGHKGKLIITHHADTLGRRFLRQFSDPFVVRAMQRAECIIVTSQRYLESSEELRPFRDKCRVIPLGIEVPEAIVPPSEAAHAVRAKFGTRLLVAVGRLVTYKGFDVLIRAMKHIDARLLLIGHGPLEGELRSLASQLSLTEKVHFVGHANDLHSYIQAASVLVMPSVTRAEAFGLVQLEAMALGVPVINTHLDSGVPEVSVDRVTGLTVAPGDVAALASAIRELLDAEEFRERLGRQAFERAREHFTADLMAERTMELYREALCSRRGGI